MDVPQRPKNRITILSNNPTPGHIRDYMIKRDTCTHIFIAAPFTIAKTCKQPKCPLIDKNGLRCGTREYYSSTKRNEIIPLAAK